jgi:hypothetical protein
LVNWLFFPSPLVVKKLVSLRGTLRIFLLYDVAEAIDLDKLKAMLGPRGIPVQRFFPRRTPEYVGFEQAPIVEACDPITLKRGETVACSVKYYSYAVVAVQIEVPFDCDWQTLTRNAARWVDTLALDAQAREIARTHLDSVAGAVIRPSSEWLAEAYMVVDLQPVEGREGRPLTAADLLSAHGDQIVQLIRGESVPLAAASVGETLQTALSYYASDLVVVSPASALVYDRPEDAAATIEILEFARTQLLEFRYYDNLMTRVLTAVYNALERKRNVFFSYRILTGDANRLNTIRLDVMELTERIDNTIKFFSDIFYARFYRLAAGRMGVPDYRALVEQKLHTAGELHDLIVDQFNEARMFLLEVAIAVLCLLDVILLLRGK